MFGDNHRISHIQMERQYQMVFFAPLLLFASSKLQGFTGLCAIVIALALLALALFFFKRNCGLYRKIDKYMGNLGSKFLIFVYQVYLVVVGVWVVVQAGSLIHEYMIQGVPRWFVMLLFVLTSLALGTKPEIRARFAEIAWPVLAVVVGIFFFFAFLQSLEGIFSDSANLTEMFRRSANVQDNFRGYWQFSWRELWKSVLILLAFMAGTALFPFMEIRQEPSDEKNVYLFRMVGKLGLWLIAANLLLTLYFGEHGADALAHPMLDLMAGVQLPGGFVRRLDLIFLTLLLFALLFTMGSICFYSAYLWEKAKLSMGRVPVLVLILLLLLSLSGCHIVEPERRAYPLVLGIDWSDENYRIYLAMAKLGESTGQEKSGAEQESNVVNLEGKDTEEIWASYDATQELYLDIGHVQALVLGEGLLEEKERAMSILQELEQNHDLGNSAFVFWTKDIEGLFEKNGTQIESLGDYLVGLYENRVKEKKPTRLGEMYREIHNWGEIMELPELKVGAEEIELKVSETKRTSKSKI